MSSETKSTSSSNGHEAAEAVSNEAAPASAAVGSGPTEGGSDRAVKGQEEAGAGQKPVLPVRIAPIFLGAFLIATLAAAGVFLAKRQLIQTAPPAPEISTAASIETPDEIEIPEQEEPPLAGAESRSSKIFNSANEGLKAGAEEIARATAPQEGSISQLPAAPARPASGNEALQDAAKDAAKLLAPKSKRPAGIDFSGEGRDEAMEAPMRAAATSAAGLASPAPKPDSGESSEALLLDIARLAGSLDQERQHTERQAAEIARLNGELAALKAIGAPAAEKARAALIFGALAERARSGAPYRRELDEFLRVSGVKAAPAAAAAADDGLATLAGLKEEFPAMRNRALAAARSEAAKGPLSRVGANLAAMVNLRPAAPIEGASAAAILSRVESKLHADDLTGAVAEADALTGPARAIAAPWIKEARARIDADAALAAMNRELIASLESAGG